MNIEIDRTFDGDYDCQVLDEIPNSAAIVNLPDQTRLVGQDGVLVRISPDDGAAWIGLFSSINKYPGALSRVIFTPNPNRICVICSGDAVIADTVRPDQSSLLDFEPITDAIAVKEREVIVFAGFTKLTAFDGTDVLWETSRIAWDGLRITGVDVTRIFGEYWDVANEKQAQFEVDLDTGEVDGTLDRQYDKPV